MVGAGGKRDSSVVDRFLGWPRPWVDRRCGSSWWCGRSQSMVRAHSGEDADAAWRSVHCHDVKSGREVN